MTAGVLASRAAAHGQQFSFDMVFVFLALAVVCFALAAYRVITAKQWKPWQELVGLALLALGVLVEFRF